MDESSDPVLLEWFGKHRKPISTPLDGIKLIDGLNEGTTTFRVRWKGLTIFLDTWLERPTVLEKYLSVADVSEADYIFISHAHFDQ